MWTIKMNTDAPSISLVILSLLIIGISAQSPCPDVFVYDTDGIRNFGIITIPPTSSGKTEVSASIGIRGPIYNRNGGGLSLLKSLDDTVDDARSGNDVQYILNFPVSEQLPIIRSITLNNEEICGGLKVTNVPTWGFTHSFTYPSGANYMSTWNRRTPGPARTPAPPVRTPAPPPRTPPTPPPTPAPTLPPTPAPTQASLAAATTDDPSWLPQLSTAATCGVRPPIPDEPAAFTVTHLIIGGETVKPGEYPWLVALFHIVREGNQQLPVYRCGATLISDRYVVTAAHCTAGQPSVYLELGKHNITDYGEPGYLIRPSQRIIPHPEYRENTGHADIALVLIEQVSFTNKIQPICLWPFGKRFDSFAKGTITGWGREENGGDMSTTPLQLKVDLVNLDQCRNSHPQLRNIATEKTLCAGGKSKGPCHGDSGSGLYIKNSDRWYLRGVISISVGNEFVCNLNEFAVYADVAHFLEWMKSYLL